MKIFFAGGESKARLNVLRKVGAKCVLMSYLYLSRKKSGIRLIKEYKKAGFKVMIDSGAHTFLEKAGLHFGGFDPIKYKRARKSFDVKEADAYVEHYFNFIKQNQGLADYWIELDIQALVGREKLDDWRDLANKMGVKIIPVWHNLVDGFKDWEELCKNYDFVAIEGGKEVNAYVKFMNVAKEHKTKIHVFAMTKPDHMRRLPFYSVDSTSWISGSRYGTAWIMKGNDLIAVKKDDFQMACNYARQKGIEKDQLEGWKGVVLDLLSAYAWRDYSEYIDKHSKKYWDTNEEESQEKKNPISPVKKPEAFNKNKGKIQEILKKNPEIEKKRRKAVGLSSKALAKNFKHGRYAQMLDDFCDNCYAQEKCQHFGKGQRCAIKEGFLKFAFQGDVKSEQDIYDYLNKILNAMGVRIARGMHFEALDGGVLDKNVSAGLAKVADTLTFLLVKKGGLVAGRDIKIDNRSVIIESKVSKLLKNAKPEARRKFIKRYKQLVSELEGDSSL